MPSMQSLSTLNEATDKPLAAVLSYNGFLLAIQSGIAVSVLKWEWISAEMLAAAEGGIAFLVALVWIFIKTLLPNLDGAANPPP